MKIRQLCTNPGIISFSVLLLVNVLGYYFNDYSAQLWWSNWAPVYAVFIVFAIKRNCKKCKRV
jgi:hypothetical protein